MSDAMKETINEQASLLRKYAYEFGLTDDVETHGLMMAAQKALHDAIDAATAQSQQEIADLRKQVAERDALLATVRKALKPFVIEMSDYVSGENPKVVKMVNDGNRALSKTLPSEALERALVAEREKCIYTMLQYGPLCRDDAVAAIRSMK